IPFFVDIITPLAMKHMLWAGISFGGRELSVIGLGRGDAGRAFSRKQQDQLREVLPALALAEAVLELRVAQPAERNTLTEQEKKLVDLFELGVTYEEAARALGVSVNTVRTHVRSLYEKLEVASKVEAVMKLRGRP